MHNYEFDNENGEFIIYNPETGKSWYNQLWNDYGYHMSVTHTGLTTSRFVDDRGKQIFLNKWNLNGVYIRDDKSGEFWNTGISPSCKKVKNYKCVHSMNMTSVSSEYNGIASETCFTVSENGTYEFWRITLKNNTCGDKCLSVFSGIEFDLGGFEQPFYYNSETTTETVYDSQNLALLCLMKNPYVPNDNGTGFVMASEPVYAYEGNYEKFVGTTGNEACPKILADNMDCSNSLCTVRRRGGVLQNKIHLPSGGEKTFYYILGLCRGREDFADRASQMREECETAFENAKAHGAERFGSLRTNTPVDRINNIMNFWAQKQVSYCMLGKKAVRDNAQLAMAMLNFNTELAKKTLKECLSHQFSDGHALLNWEISQDRSNLYSDPPMWIILSVCEYIKETGDKTFLDEIIEYEDGTAANVYEHLKQAANWYLQPQNIGKNGLPKIHYADWNDALNIPDSEAESVFMAMSVCLAYKELSMLAEYMEDIEYAQFLLKKKTQLAECVNKAAYNGEYYIRAISKYGKIGDKTCDGGRIYINPQVWAILAEVVPTDRLESVLNSIDNMETERGIPLCYPPYYEYSNVVGRMSGMLPGVYENGGIYNHACGFKIMADCKMGRSEQAVNTLLKVIPDGKLNPSSITTTEPYVFTNCYLQHKAVDMTVGFSWQTGTSAWMLRDFYEGILGLRRTYEGLQIVPCMPLSWKDIYAERWFRGNLLKITYCICREGEVAGLFADGEKIEGNTVPEFADNNPHNITVKIKKSAVRG